MSQFINKEKRKKVAKNHTEIMAIKFPDEIQNSISNTCVYTRETLKNIKHRHPVTPTCQIVDDTSVSTAMRYKKPDYVTAILNFASFTNPGGGFLNGSRAQEESLCHDSFLYNVLNSCKEFYQTNRQDTNHGLYHDRGLYSKNVRFFDPTGIVTDVFDIITVAAPNKNRARKYHVSDDENTKALSSRIKFILDMAETNFVDCLILGAFGCGCFGQNPTEVAELFKYHIKNGNYGFKQIYFAIPKAANNENYTAFKNVF